MECPRDRREMEHQGYHKYPRHACPECHGVFVLERDITENIGARGKRLETVAQVKLDNIRDSKLRCPKDGAALKAVFFGEAEIDVCAECHGLWLDRGEYEKIVASMRMKTDAMRRNKVAVTADAAAPASGSSVNFDNVLSLLGTGLQWTLIWARVMTRSTARNTPVSAPEIIVPDRPNCRRR